MLMTDHPARDEAAALVCQGQRPQPYRFIHKALRALMLHTLQQLAQLDAADPAERATLVAAIGDLLQRCTDHLTHENTFFHMPLRARAPRAVLPFDDDHQDHVATILALRSKLDLVANAGPTVRADAYQLYLELTRFVADNLEHMADEETLLTRALWQHFSDIEILDMEQRLRVTLTPEERSYYLRWMARGLSTDELVGLAQAAHASMPPPAFAGLCSVLAEELTPQRWKQLSQALDTATATA